MATFVRQKPYPQYARYQQYKPRLRVDFGHSCAYCTIHEREWGGLRHFHVEHFRPRSRFPSLETEYENLMYACDVCNSYKSNDWPSENPIEEGIGYLDPCEHDFEDHFDNDLVKGTVRDSTPPAKYMIERLHLNRPFLTKMRQTRAQSEAMYDCLQLLCSQTIEMITTCLQKRSLEPDVVQSLEAAQALILLLWDRETERWAKRWEPPYEADDLH